MVGNSVSGAGDVNGDGIADVLVGASSGVDSLEGTRPGLAMVVFGHSSATSFTDMNTGDSFGKRGYRLMGAANGDAFGALVRAAGDVNNDGVGDFIIAAPNYDVETHTDVGAGYVIFGQICSPGTHYLNATQKDVCVDCPAGWYSTFAGAENCIKCPAASYANSTGSVSCTHCVLGTYADTEGSATCTLCPAGTFGGGTTLESCIFCPKSMYSPVEGASSYSTCIHCPAGRVTATRGTALLSQCMSPMANFIQGTFALAVALVVSVVYIMLGRMNAVAYGRMRYIQKAGDSYVTLIKSIRCIAERKVEETRSGLSQAPILELHRRVRVVVSRYHCLPGDHIVRQNILLSDDCVSQRARSSAPHQLCGSRSLSTAKPGFAAWNQHFLFLAGYWPSLTCSPPSTSTSNSQTSHASVRRRPSPC